ncbi:MAG: hypothetical protein ACLFR0_02070 [Alphaproteobacteria bacterium]
MTTNTDTSPKNVLAVLNCVVDHLYAAHSVNHEKMEEFLKSLPETLGLPQMETPRAGDTVLLSQSQLEKAAKTALQISADFNDAATTLQDIFGTPSLAPGGSLANTMATIVTSSKNGTPLVNTTILTVLDEGEAGDIFKNSYPEGVVLEDIVHGECLKVHVVPYDGDRSQFPTYSDHKPAHHPLSVPLFNMVKGGQYDEIYIEGFLADAPDFENDAKTLLTAVSAGNQHRDMMGQTPIRLNITAGAQHICNNPVFRNFVKLASELTDVSIHANTGEFRRLLDNDENWRVEAQKDFQGLSGRELEAAKKASNAYRAAKTQANIHTIEKFMNEWGSNIPYDLECVVTDGGNTGYVVNNDHYYTFTPDPIDPSTIVNKVGAGDAFMAYYRLGRELGLSQIESMKAGGIGATHTLQQEEARPEFFETHDDLSGPVSLLKAKGLLDNSDTLRKIREFPYITPENM